MTVTATISDDNDLFTPVHPAGEPIDVKRTHEIRSSPYYEQPHLLDLTVLTPEYKALSLALQSFGARNSQYASEEYEEAFNIPQVIELARIYAKDLGASFDNTTLYVIAFRSILFEEVQESVSKREWLGSIDKASHEEANESGGLIKYWFGVPDNEHAKNLATCWWTSKEDAVRGGGGKKHREGMKAVRSWFKHWKVEEYKVTVNPEGYEFKKM